MELLVTFAVVLVSLAAVVGLVGVAAPREHAAVREIEIDAPPAEVWAVMADFEGQPRWHPGFDSIERLADRHGHPAWRVRYKSGETDEVVVLDAAAPTRLVWRFEEQHHAFRGRWEATLQPLDDGRRTRVAVTQRLNLRHPVARALALVRGRDAAVRLYLGSLAARFAEERPAASSA